MSSTYTTRNPAKRVFAGEYDDATIKRQEGNEPNSPIYLLLPTGEWANKVFIAGTLTEVVVDESEQGTEYATAEVTGATGDFRVIAGVGSELAKERLKNLRVPCFVAVTGSTSTFEPNEGEVYTQIRASEVSTLEPGEYDQWVEVTAQETRKRIEQFEDSKNEPANVAKENYDDLDVEKYQDDTEEALQTSIDEIVEESDLSNDNTDTEPSSDQDGEKDSEEEPEGESDSSDDGENKDDEEED